MFEQTSNEKTIAEVAKLTAEVKVIRWPVYASLAGIVVQLLVASTGNHLTMEMKERDVQSHDRDVKREAIERLSFAVAKYDESLAACRELAYQEDPTKKPQQLIISIGCASRMFNNGYNQLTEELYRQAPKIDHATFAKVSEILQDGLNIAFQARNHETPLSQHYHYVQKFDTKMKPDIAQFWNLAHESLGLSEQFVAPSSNKFIKWPISDYDVKLLPHDVKGETFRPWLVDDWAKPLKTKKKR